MENKRFWHWRNETIPIAKNEDGSLEAQTVRVLELNGTIAESTWFDDDVTPEVFKDELFSGDGDIVVWINSPGGDCIAASRIYSMLMDYKGHVTVKIDGIAASAASVIAMAGTEVLMAPTAMMMIHNPITGAFGNHEDMQKAIEMLDEVKEAIINAYEIKTGQSRAKLSHLMDSETWMNSNKAIELGFADALIEDGKKSTEAFSFSGRASENALLNKIAGRVKTSNIEVKPVLGIRISELDKRLELIKP